MDLLRLALERAVTPKEAIGVIVDMLEEYGQCFRQAADAEEGWLERVWLLAEKKSFLHGITWCKLNQEAGYL
jgi:hypothetical protein